MSAKADLKMYFEGMERNDVDLCLSIERRHGLDGYPPNIVTFALQAIVDGKNMYKAIDEMMGL